MNILKNLNDLLDFIEDRVKKIKPQDKICVLHHDDSDGCCSAALFSILVHKLTGEYPILFPIVGLENVNSKLIKSLKSTNPDHVFVFDMTVDPSYLNIFKGFVLDHHIFSGIKQREDMPYINPRSYEENDENVPPTSYITHKIIKRMLSEEKVSWISGIGITEDHRVDLCNDVFEEIKKENPNLLKVNDINQKNIEESFYGELCDMVRSGRMVRGVEGARTAVLALIECKDRPDKFVNGLTQHSSALRRFYEKLSYETQNFLTYVEKKGKFYKKEKIIVYEQPRMRLRGMTSFLSDKIRQKYPEWISYVINKENENRKAKISIRLEQTKRNEDLNYIINRIKQKMSSVKGGGHKSAVGVVLDIEDIYEFEKKFVNLVHNE